jgi:hypothetical protein
MMADSKKKALIQAAAEMIRKAGKQTAGADTVLAHITPEEAAKLKAEGGSGRTDPKTGLPHFDGPGGAGVSKADSGSRSRGNSKDDDEDKYEKELKDLKEHFGPETEADREAAKELARDMDAYGSGRGDSQEGTPVTIPANMTQEQRLMRQEQLVTGAATQTANAVEQATAAKKKAQAAVKFGVSPTDLSLSGLALHGLNYAGKRALAGSKAYNESLSAEGLEQGRTTNTLGASEFNGGNSDEAKVKAPVADETTDTKKLTETVAAPTFDDFVSKARKKKNYMSTILGGGVPAGTPQGKKLLGS